MNVLVVIDVQNCFMFHSEGEANGGTFLNAGQEASKEIVAELETLVGDKTHVVFSRDFHPVNHISLEEYEGRTIDYVSIWPKHCRNKTLQCKSRKDPPPADSPVESDKNIVNNFVDTETGTVILHDTPEWTTKKNERNADAFIKNQFLEVVGTELSYIFFTSAIFRDPVRQLVLGNRNGKHKIGLNDTTSESITGKPKVIDKADAERTINYGNSLQIDGGTDTRKYISLTKGERCDKEAYSAFNYHIQYTPSKPYDPKNTKYEHIKPDNAINSTGLWEWILKNRNGQNEITVTVCGLVGNVCVMHSLLQGIALWNNVYSKLPENKDVKVKFVYSMKGTRFAAVPPFDKIGVKPDFVKDNVVGHFNENIPKEMNKVITLSEPSEPSITPKNGELTSFEVLDYDGKLIKIGTFNAPPVKGGMRRRSVRRRKNKSQKRQKSRRTYKNKRRNTKQRI